MEYTFGFDGVPYNEGEWQRVARTLGQSGVGPRLGLLAVSADGTGLNVSVAPGDAMVEGVHYASDAPILVPVSAANPGQPRITSVILRLDRAANTVLATTKDGAAAANPAAPALTQTDVLYELLLANVTVPAGAGVIQAANVVDRRRFLNAGLANVVRGEAGSPADSLAVMLGDGSLAMQVLSGGGLRVTGRTAGTPVAELRAHVGQTADILRLTDSVGASLAAFGAGGGLELGRRGTAQTPFVDFHSGAADVDFDSRLIASGGSGVSGRGTLTLLATDFALDVNGAGTGRTRFTDDGSFAYHQTDRALRWSGIASGLSRMTLGTDGVLDTLGDHTFTSASRRSIYPTTPNQGLQVRGNGSGVLQLNSDSSGEIHLGQGGGITRLFSSVIGSASAVFDGTVQGGAAAGGDAFAVGNDMFLVDVNSANRMALHGFQNRFAAELQLGQAGPILFSQAGSLFSNSGLYTGAGAGGFNALGALVTTGQIELRSQSIFGTAGPQFGFFTIVVNGSQFKVPIFQNA